MNLNENKENLVELLQKLAGEEYEVSLQVVVSATKKEDCIVVTNKALDADVAFAMEKYCCTGHTLEDIAKNIFEDAEVGFSNMKKTITAVATSMGDWNIAKQCLSAHVCSVHNNEDFLNGIAWYQYLDLAVYFQTQVECSVGTVNAVITTDMLRIWGVQIEELKKAADENYPEETVEVMIVNQVTNAAHIPFKELKRRWSEVKDKDLTLDSFYGLSYAGAYCGGNLIARPDILGQIAEGLGSDLMIIPDSIEDIIVHTCTNNRMAYDIQSEQIKSMNECFFGKDGFMILSNHPYIYSRKEKKVLEEKELDSYFGNN